MKRRGLLLAAVLILAAMSFGIQGPAAATTGSGGQVQTEGCPLYIACMDSITGGCFCPGFYCNGRFICGTPIT
jgi:hypothetical protein